MKTLAENLVATLRTAAQAYAAGDQVAPCAVLWADPERLWEPVVPDLLTMMPELFTLGSRQGSPCICLCLAEWDG